MTDTEQKIIDYVNTHQRSHGFVGEFEENIDYVKLGGYVSVSGKVVYLDHTADMMKNSVLYAGAPDVSDVPAQYKTEVIVCEEDTITAGKNLLDEGCNPILLSFANRSTPGWGVWNGYPSQENGLLRRSDLFASIFQFDKENAKLAGIPVKTGNQYPMDRNVGGVYSPNVTFFRAGGRKGFQFLDDPYQLSVISMSAIYSPDIDDNGNLTNLMVHGYIQKIRTMFRIALSNGHNAIVLGAWGCGDGRTPPEQLAEIFRNILIEDEFRNKFVKVVFAIFMNNRALRAFRRTFGTPAKDFFKSILLRQMKMMQRDIETLIESQNIERKERLWAFIPLGISFLLWGVGCIAFYCERVTDTALIIWWILFCSWNGVYYSLRKKNPESKWKWDLANVIAWVLLMPCSIIGYMIYRGVF